MDKKPLIEIKNLVKKRSNFTSYLKFLDRKKIILDQNVRKQLIVKQIDKVCRTRKLKKKLNETKRIDIVESLAIFSV